jgi:3-oxoadipate enol-lactonase
MILVAQGSPMHLNAIRTGPRGGAPVVLLHAAGLDLTYWDTQIAALGAEHDVVAFDLPGHGRSEGGPQDWTLDAVSRAVADAVTALGAGPVHLVGLSVGGIVAQGITLARPAAVRSLTLIDTAAAFPDAARAAMRAQAAEIRTQGMAAMLGPLTGHWFRPETLDRRPDLLDRVLKTLLTDDPLVQAAVRETIAGADLLGELRHISCPVMILVGEFDPTSPVAAARAMQAEISHSELHVIPDTAHMSPLEKPETISRHLLAFIAS